MNEAIDRLFQTGDASNEELKALIDLKENSFLREAAAARRKEHYGNDVYIRGLIEFSSYCRNNCYYCGIRAGQKGLRRYRLGKEDILRCCDEGYVLGFRTFVLQSGEDYEYADETLCDIISSIKSAHPDCAVTLSIGERPRASYQAYFDAGAERYLLRHETASPEHYRLLHPASQSLENRMRCLWDLKKIGYQVGSGFMVGSPYQTLDNLVADLRFLQELQPDMIGIGPFIPAHGTPFADRPAGSAERTLNLISILRLMFPYSLIPSTTSLGSISPQGRLLGLLAGANVIMPNLSPIGVRQLYSLYDHKAILGAESASGLDILRHEVASIGYKVVVDRGDVHRAH
jgi:biotin synthase